MVVIRYVEFGGKTHGTVSVVQFFVVCERRGRTINSRATPAHGVLVAFFCLLWCVVLHAGLAALSAVSALRRAQGAIDAHEDGGHFP